MDYLIDFKPLSTYLSPASLSKMVWLALIFLFWLYLRSFKSGFAGLKSKVGSLNGSLRGKGASQLLTVSGRL